MTLLAVVLGCGCTGGRPLAPAADAGGLPADAGGVEPLGDFRYTLGCGSRTGCFSKDRDINGFNDEAGVIVSCMSGSVAAGSTLSFRLSAIDPIDMSTRFSFTIANVIYDDATGSPLGTSGVVTVAEGATSYTGTISANPPSSAVPCQLLNIAKTMDDIGNPQIEGDILCGASADPAVGLTQSGAPSVRRDIHDPASVSTAAHFRIVLCDGLPIAR